MKLLIYLGIGALLCIAAPAAAQTVILVRHAEKMDQSVDPQLSEAGRARAQALATALSGTRLTHILVTPLQRTTQTASVTAESQGLSVEPISIEGGALHIERVVSRIRELPPEAVVLVVGHSNTIPSISRDLGAAAGDMDDCEFDRLTMIDLREDQEPVVITSRYGAASQTCSTSQ